jgi:hypothetical protein
MGIRIGEYLLATLVPLPFEWGLSSALMVCTSALFRRVWTAITACYLLEFAAMPLLSFGLGSLRDHWLGEAVRQGLLPEWVDEWSWLAVFLVTAALQAAVLALLLPQALRAIATPASYRGPGAAEAIRQALKRFWWTLKRFWWTRGLDD